MLTDIFPAINFNFKKSWNWLIILRSAAVCQILIIKQMQWPETEIMCILWNLLGKRESISIMNLFSAGFSYLELLEFCPGCWRNKRIKIMTKNEFHWRSYRNGGWPRQNQNHNLDAAWWQSQIHNSISVNAQTGKLFSFCLACQSEPFKSMIASHVIFRHLLKVWLFLHCFFLLLFYNSSFIRFGIYNLFVSAWIRLKPRVS